MRTPLRAGVSKIFERSRMGARAPSGFLAPRRVFRPPLKPASRVASRGPRTGIMKDGVLCAPHAQKIPTTASRESTRKHRP